MQKTVFQKGLNNTVEFRPNCPSTTKPSIKRTYFEGKGDGRTRMYETTDGRVFLADVFDYNFNQAVKIKMKPKNFKATSIDPRHIY